MGTVAAALVLAATPAPAGAGQGAGDDEPDEASPIRVVTIAGNGEVGYSGDGGDALDARLNSSLALDVDSRGNVYIADALNRRVRRIDTDGTIDTVAGTRGDRPAGADGPSTPRSVAVDSRDHLYVAGAHSVRRRDSDGRFQVITSSGGEANPGDGGPALDAVVYDPDDVAVDAAGNVYIADTVNGRIRKVGTNGVITTVAGGGDLDLEQSEGGPATDASVVDPHSVDVDSRGNVYFIEDRGGRTVRKVGRNGVITTVVGRQEEGFSGDGGPAAEARLSGSITGVAVGPDDALYIADGNNGLVRRVDTEGIISTVPASLPGVSDVAVGPRGDLYVTAGAMVRKVVPGGAPAADEASEPDEESSPDPPWTAEAPGTVVTAAGVAREPDGDPPAVAAEGPLWPGDTAGAGPRGIAVGAEGTMYVADTLRHRVLEVEPGGSPAVVAGTGEAGYAHGGTADETQLDKPEDVAVDAEGNLYIADAGNNRILRVEPDGTSAIVAGALDGLSEPRGVAVDPAGVVFVADTGHRRVGKVGPDGTVTTIAGGGERWASEADGAPATEASLWDPVEVAADGAGNVYLIEDRNQSVRKVTADGTLVTVAGNPELTGDEGGFSGDGGPATEAELNTPGGVAVGADGSIYIADTLNSRIRRVGRDGAITTVAGTGRPRDAGDDGPASEASVDEPEDLAVGPDGSLYLAGRRTDRVRRIDRSGTIATVAELGIVEGPAGEAADGLAETEEGRRATEVELGGPRGIAVTGRDLYIGESTGLVDGAVEVVDARGRITTLDASPTGPGMAGVSALAASPDGRLYFVAGGGVARRDPDGLVTTVAGASGVSLPSGDEDTVPEDGRVAVATPMSPVDLAIGGNGDLYVADLRARAVYRITAGGRLTVVEGSHADRITGIGGIALDRDGRLYIAEGVTGGGYVHRVDPDGSVTTIAGSDEVSRSSPDDIGDGGPATDALLSRPTDVAVDPDGNVYISERAGRVRRVDPDGTITTVADGLGRSQGAAALALDDRGDLYVLTPDTSQVRVVVQPGEIAGPGSSRWGTVAGAVGAVLALALGTLAVWRRRQLAELVSRLRGRWADR